MQAVVARPGEWVRYSPPEPGGAEYIAVCTPAFSADAVHRDGA
jgi:ethanolamine utilization protein EutQ